jgi:hypothetical protein
MNLTVDTSNYSCVYTLTDIVVIRSHNGISAVNKSVWHVVVAEMYTTGQIVGHLGECA